MLSGKLLWGEKLVADMVLVKHRDRYCLSYPDMKQNMYEVLKASAAAYAGKTAIVDDDGAATTFDELFAKTDSFADVLALDHGVRKGTRVGLLLYNSLEFCVAFFALCKLGAVAVPLPTKYKRQEIESIAEKSRLKTLILDREFETMVGDFCVRLGIRGLSCPTAEGSYGFEPGRFSIVNQEGGKVSVRRAVSARTAAHRCGLDDDCILMFTSGTTSMSKGTVLSNLNLMHAVISYQRLLNLSSSDISIIPMPIYHITGLAALLSLFVHIGGTLHLHRKFNPERVLAEVLERNITFIHASPTIFIKMLEHRRDFPRLPSLRQLACGSANMPIKYLRELKSWLPNISFRTIYGLTETCSPASVFPGDAASSPHIGSSGMPIPGLLMKVVDEAGRELPNGQIGELAIRGTVVMEEYDHLDEGFLDDRWFRTGDLARLTDDGYVYITDRKKDMINRAGEKVWSYELENLLHECPGVAEAAVVGMPDDVYGEVVVALIKPTAGSQADGKSVVDYLSDKVAKYKIPSRVAIADEIPRNANGKVDKNAIRRMLGDGAPESSVNR